jgi:hypothetical protein
MRVRLTKEEGPKLGENVPLISPCSGPLLCGDGEWNLNSRLKSVNPSTHPPIQKTHIQFSKHDYCHCRRHHNPILHSMSACTIHASTDRFTLFRSDTHTHHFYTLTGTQFVDTLQRFCSTLPVSIYWKPGSSSPTARSAASLTTKDVTPLNYFATTPTHTFPTP